jgi:hypothetical protein
MLALNSLQSVEYNALKKCNKLDGVGEGCSAAEVGEGGGAGMPKEAQHAAGLPAASRNLPTSESDRGSFKTSFSNFS